MNDIRDKILQENGINPIETPQQQIQGIQLLIKREKIWSVVTKIITGILWMSSLVVLGLYMYAVKLFIHNQQAKITDPFMKDTANVIMTLDTVLPLIIILSVACTVFLYIRSKSSNLLQVHERLHNLEEMVKVLLSKQ